MSKKTSPLDWEEFADFLQRQRGSQGIIGGMERYTVPSDNTRTVQTTHARTEGRRQQGVRKAIAEENKLRDKEHRPHISTEAQLAEARQMRKAATDLANNMGYIRGIDVVNNPTEKIQGSIQQMGLNVDPTTYTYGSPGVAYNKGKSLVTGIAAAAPLFTGFVTAPIQTGTSLLTGIGGGYAGTKAGEAAADYLGVKDPTDRAWITNGGGFLGGMIGGGLGYKVGDVGVNAYNNWIHSPTNINFIRNLGDVPVVDENGMFWMSPKDNALTNMTWPESFRTHRNYRHYGRPGENYLVINPKSLQGERFLSTDPMDTFIQNKQIPAKDVTFISGNPEMRALAKERGFNVATSEEIDAAYKPVAKLIAEDEVPQPGQIVLGKGTQPFHGEAIKTYDNTVNKYIQSEFGKPGLLDAWKFRLQTGVNPHLRFGFGLNYNPTTAIEAKLAKKYDFDRHPSTSSLSTEKYATIADDLGSKPFFTNYPKESAFERMTREAISPKNSFSDILPVQTQIPEGLFSGFPRWLFNNAFQGYRSSYDPLNTSVGINFSPELAKNIDPFITKWLGFLKPPKTSDAEVADAVAAGESMYRQLPQRYGVNGMLKGDGQDDVHFWNTFDYVTKFPKVADSSGFHNAVDGINIKLPSIVWPWQRSLYKKKILGTIAHEAGHSQQIYDSAPDIVEYGRGLYHNYKGYTIPYKDPNNSRVFIRPTTAYDKSMGDYDFANYHVNDSPLWANKKMGEWEGSPNELLSEVDKLRYMGYIKSDGNINNKGLRSLAERFDSSVDDITKGLQRLQDNYEYVPYQYRPESKSSYIRDWFALNSGNLIRDGILVGGAIGVGAGLGKMTQ